MNFKPDADNDLSFLLYKEYYLKNNATQFIVDYTDLFTEQDGTPFEPYLKQALFMNTLKKTDKVIVVLKPRQCIIGDSLIELDSSKKTIKELFESNYRGKIWTYDKTGLFVLDEIIDIWEAGYKDIYEIKLNNGEYLECTDQHKFSYNGDYNKFITIKEILEKNIDLNLIKINCHNYTYIGIKSIKKLDYKQMTYDLTTKTTHTYIANGIHVHNSGFSTAIVGSCVYDAFFGKYPELVVVSASRSQAQKNLARIKQAFLSMPEEIRPVFTKDNSEEIKLQNGTSIVTLSTNPDTARGRTGKVFLDEAGVIPKKDSYELYTALYPTITKGGCIILVSTPKGKEGLFFDLCNKSLAEMKGEKTSFDSKKIFINWKDVPHIKYAVENEGLFDGLTPAMIAQEYELQFVDDSEESYFNGDYLHEYFKDRDSEDWGVVRELRDIGVVDDFDFKQLMNDYDMPLPTKYLHSNQRELMKETYSRCVAGFDPASKNDDSVCVILGELRANPGKWRVVAELFVREIDDNTISQFKYLKRFFDYFDVSELTLDSTGFGFGLGQHIELDETYGERLTQIQLNNSNKLAGFIDCKDYISNNKLKTVWNGDKFDQIKFDQMKNVYVSNGKVTDKKHLKNDYAFALMLATMGINQSIQSGFNFTGGNLTRPNNYYDSPDFWNKKD